MLCDDAIYPLWIFEVCFKNRIYTIFQYAKHRTWIILHHMKQQPCTFQMLHSHSRLQKIYEKDSLPLKSFSYASQATQSPKVLNSKIFQGTPAPSIRPFEGQMRSTSSAGGPTKIFSSLWASITESRNLLRVSCTVFDLRDPIDPIRQNTAFHMQSWGISAHLHARIEHTNHESPTEPPTWGYICKEKWEKVANIWKYVRAVTRTTHEMQKAPLELQDSMPFKICPFTTLNRSSNVKRHVKRHVNCIVLIIKP